MALLASTVWEIRTTGSDNNGGGFDGTGGGTDFSQQNAAQATLTAASVLGPAANQVTVSAGDYTTVAGDVGNILQITGGTATAGFYRIASVNTGTNVWTLDRNAGTIGQTVVGAMGGALASLAKAGGAYITSNKIWVKAGTYSITTATTNVAAGCLSTAQGIKIEGYNAARGDMGTKPLLQASAINTFTLISIASNSQHLVSNLKLDGASAVSSRGIMARMTVYKCEFVNFTNSAIFSDTAVAVAIQCSATGCSGFAAFKQIFGIACIAFDNTVTGFEASSSTFIDCIADTNTGATSDGFTSSGLGPGDFINCVAYNNGRDGFRAGASRGTNFVNCIAEGNAGWGINANNNQVVTAINCAYYNNTSGAFSAGTGDFVQNIGAITLTGSPFNNAAGQDFGLNNTASQGAACRAAGLPGVFVAGSTTAYQDVGAAQHQDTGGGGGNPYNAAYLG